MKYEECGEEIDIVDIMLERGGDRLYFCSYVCFEEWMEDEICLKEK